MSGSPHNEAPGGGYEIGEHEHHVALLYEDPEEYLDGIMRFVQPALRADEPVAAAVPPAHGELLRRRLNGSSHNVQILDMFELGRNPARIIPAVEGLLAEHGGGRLHYIGEPIWPGRSPDETREATKHEALINLAWPEAPIRVLCPYDAGALSPEVLLDAERTHPWVIRKGEARESDAYTGPSIPHHCEQALSPPPSRARSMRFGLDDLFRLRSLVGEVAQGVGLDSERTADLLLVTSELSTNAIRHGEGAGVLDVWSQGAEIICQVSDGGEITDPLAGRRVPVLMATSGGRGLWMVNQLCDLVEVRTGAHGTTVRAHVGVG